MKLILLVGLRCVVLCEVKEFEAACFCRLPVLPLLLCLPACLSSTMTAVLFIKSRPNLYILIFFMRIYFNWLLFNKLNSEILKSYLKCFIIFSQQIIGVKLLFISKKKLLNLSLKLLFC